MKKTLYKQIIETSDKDIHNKSLLIKMLDMLNDKSKNTLIDFIIDLLTHISLSNSNYLYFISNIENVPTDRLNKLFDIETTSLVTTFSILENLKIEDKKIITDFIFDIKYISDKIREELNET